MSKGGKSKEKNIFSDTKSMVLISVLTALLVLLTFTPLGLSLRIGFAEITFMCIPVCVGAVMLGPDAGAFLGLAFGILSYITAITGYSGFGAMLVAYSGFYAFIVCILPRILCGFVSGLVFRLFNNNILHGKKLGFQFSSAIGCFVCSLLNTVLFCGSIFLLYRTVPLGENGTIGKAIVAAGVANGIPEAIACLIVGTAVCTALKSFVMKGKN